MNESDLKRAPLAYENETFLNSPDGRILRILSEYTEPISRFRREQIQDTVVFFGSARFHSRATAEGRLAELEAMGAQLPGQELERCRKNALAAVNMARYYEDARRLAFLLSRSDEVEKIGKAVREKIEREHSWETIAKKTMEI